MSMPTFDVDVAMSPVTELIISLPHDERAFDIVEPTLGMLGDRVLAQPSLEDFLRVVVISGTTCVFDSASAGGFLALSQPRTVLRGPYGPRSAGASFRRPTDGLILSVAAADRPIPNPRPASWAMVLWLVGASSDAVVQNARSAWQAQRTVCDLTVRPDAFKAVVEAFVRDVVAVDTLDTAGWLRSGFPAQVSDFVVAGDFREPLAQPPTHPACNADRIEAAAIADSAQAASEHPVGEELPDTDSGGSTHVVQPSTTHPAAGDGLGN